MRGRLLRTAGPPLAAAVLGNAFVGRAALDWFQGLRRPAMQLPMAGFYTVGALNYVVMGVVVHRAVGADDRRAYGLATAVLAGGELWNGLFFGLRSPGAGLLGLGAFVPLLAALQVAVRRDPVSRAVLAPYTAWVVGYDVPWLWQLWRLNGS